MAASGKKAWEARSTRGKLLRRVAGVAILGALAVTAPVIASGLEPTMRSTGTTQMESTPEVVYINSVSDPDQRLVNFNENWKFNLGDVSGANAEVFDDSSWESVNLPHDYSIDQEYTAAGEAESGYKLGGIGWYRKSFEVGADLEGKTIRLDFDGVYLDATVWVNGHELGNHPYGYSPFSFDITDYLNYGGENSIAVKVNHQTPSSRWYSGSGIGRDVEIVVTDQVHVEKDGVVVTTPNLASGDATTHLKTTVANDTAEAVEVELVQTILASDGTEVGKATTPVTVEADASKTVEANAAVTSYKLWDLSDNPALYTARTEVTVDGEVVDTYDTTFGYRYTSYDANGFLLNGERIKLHTTTRAPSAPSPRATPSSARCSSSRRWALTPSAPRTTRTRRSSSRSATRTACSSSRSSSTAGTPRRTATRMTTLASSLRPSARPSSSTPPQT